MVCAVEYTVFIQL